VKLVALLGLYFYIDVLVIFYTAFALIWSIFGGWTVCNVATLFALYDNKLALRVMFVWSFCDGGCALFMTLFDIMMVQVG